MQKEKIIISNQIVLDMVFFLSIDDCLMQSKIGLIILILNIFYNRNVNNKFSNILF